tara:strand:- start:92 stop:451 length:360 start_codon:yes stop_codon:yes gene_type:complete
MIKKIISPVIIFLVLLGTCIEVSKSVAMPLLFIDFPSIIIVSIITIAYAYSKQNNYFIEIGNGAVYAGWLCFLIGLISINIEFANMNLDIKTLLKSHSVLWLGVFYGYSIRLIVYSIKF